MGGGVVLGFRLEERGNGTVFTLCFMALLFCVYDIIWYGFYCCRGWCDVLEVLDGYWEILFLFFSFLQFVQSFGGVFFQRKIDQIKVRCLVIGRISMSLNIESFFLSFFLQNPSGPFLFLFWRTAKDESMNLGAINCSWFGSSYWIHPSLFLPYLLFAEPYHTLPYLT